MMANTFEVNTINGSSVMPKIAGTLSIANNTSVLSITSSTKNRRGHVAAAILSHKKSVAVRSCCHSQKPSRDAQHNILIRMRLASV